MIIKKYSKCFKTNNQIFFEPIFIYDKAKTFDKHCSCENNYNEIFDLREDLLNIDLDEFYNIYVTLLDKNLNFLKAGKLNISSIYIYKRELTEDSINFISENIINYINEEITHANKIGKIKFNKNLANGNNIGYGFISFSFNIEDEFNPKYAIFHFTDVDIKNKHRFLINEDKKILQNRVLQTVTNY